MKLFRFYLPLSGLLLAVGLSAQPPANSGLPPTYLLSRGDQISIKAANAEEFNDQIFRLESDGSVTLPLVGKLKVEGMTVSQLESNLTSKLREFIREPQVNVTVVQAQTPDRIFLVGHFKNPGPYPLRTTMTLIQVLMESGGLQMTAGRTLRLTRRMEEGAIPLPAARTNMDGSSTVTIAVSSLQDGASAAQGIVLRPFDVLLADRAPLIYVDGDVGRPGTVELGERDFVPLSQVVSLSGGLSRDASHKVRVLRPIMDTSRRAEVIIDLDKVYRGEANDFPLLPNDFLFVPRSGKHVALGRTATTLIGIGIAVITSLSIGLR